MAENMLKPSPGLLCKLASIAVHAAEFLSPDGHELDKQALDTLYADPEVSEWLEQMTAAAMAPRRRDADA